MHKRSFIILLLATVFCMPAKSVLKEKDLSQTLSILRDELVSYYHDQQEMAQLVKKRNTQMRNDMIQTMQMSNENALMIYSQKSDCIFDLKYACDEATEQYNEYAR